MNIFLKLGNYLEKRFPEKITAAEVNAVIQTLKQDVALDTREIKALIERMHSVEKLFEDFKKVKEEIALIKAQSIMKTRLAQNVPDNMTAFASRFQPSGGNKSPQ